MNPTCKFAEGCMFTSLKSLTTAVRELEKYQNAVFVRRSSTKAMHPEMTELQYAAVVYECKHGSTRKSRSQGVRPNQRSLKLGCQAKVRLNAKIINGLWQLVVSKSCLNHNGHVPTLESVSLLPERRRPMMTTEVKTLLECPSMTVADIRDTVLRQQNVYLLPKDVHNMRAKQKSILTVSDQTAVQHLLSLITDNGGRVKVSKDTKENFIYLAYQTKGMCTFLNKYPEVLILDITYKTNVYQLPLLTVKVVDGHGRGQTVLHAFLSSEIQTVLIQVLDFLKSSYSSEKTSCFFVEKDFSEIGVISGVFPDAKVMLCAFHVSAAIQKALSERGLKRPLLETISSLFGSMKDTECASEYEVFKERIREIAPADVLQYLESSWWNKPELWAAHTQLDTVQLHVTTTNHCELYHSKIKKSLHYQMPLNKVVQFLLKYDEQIHSTSIMNSLIQANSRHHNMELNNPIADKIKSDMTSFAAQHVIKQLLAIDKCTFSIITVGDGFEVSSDNKSYTCTSFSCTCAFFRHFNLPCRHIFSVRRFCNESIYIPLEEGHRFKNCSPVNLNLQILGSSGTSVHLVETQPSSTEVRFTAASLLSGKIASYLSLLGDRDFEEKFDQLSALYSLWQGEDIDVSDDSVTPTGDKEPCASLAVSLTEQPILSSGLTFSTSSEATLSSDVCSSCNLNVPFSDNISTDGPSSQTVSSTNSAVLSSSGLSNCHISSLQPSLLVSSCNNAAIADAQSEPNEVSFSSVKLLAVKVKGRPRSKQTFTLKRRAATPLPVTDWAEDKKINFFIKACVLEESEPPFFVKDLKCTTSLGSCLVGSELHFIKSYFSIESWEELQRRVQQKLSEHLFVCPVCTCVCYKECRLIRCGCCLEWFHCDCVNYRSSMKCIKWFCPSCL